MSFEAIKQELASMDVGRRHEIIAYLLSIDDQGNPEYRKAMTEQINDKDRSNWMTLEQMDRRLGLGDE